MPPRVRSLANDDGFSLLEVMVGILLVTIVMVPLSVFFLNSVSATSMQSGKQAAVALAVDGIERARGLDATELVSGRDQTSVAAQWGAPLAGAGSTLTTTTAIYDTTAAPGAGATAALPTTADTTVRNQHTFTRAWYVGQCWQSAAGGDCSPSADSTGIPFVRVIVAVNWTDRRCTGPCSFVTSALFSATSDPEFVLGSVASAPVVANPGNQNSDIGLTVALALMSSGGAPAITWSATGLPTGLIMTPDGIVQGTPTVAGTYTVLATATDGFTLAGTARFTWTVNPALVVTSPGAQRGRVGTAVSVLVPVAGGTAPLTWKASGLPAGLSINSATGLISGSPTAGSPSVSVSAADALGATSTVVFAWSVSSLTLAVAPPTAEVGIAVSAAVTATGGQGPYTYAANGLPPGVTVTSTGALSGVPTTAGNYSIIVTVTDHALDTASATANWVVVSALAAVAPASTAMTVGTPTSQQLSTTGGTGALTWTYDAVPPGLTLNAQTGLLSGTPTVGTQLLTTFTVIDALGARATVTVPWPIASTGLRITNPLTTLGSPLGSPARTRLTAAGGAGGYTWTAASLPPGLSLSTTGVLAGTPTTRGTFRVNVYVTDRSGARSFDIFDWTVS